MEELINTFKEWPVIVQGALGSALFWLILKLWGKASNYLSIKNSKRNVNSRKDWLITENFKLQMMISDDINIKGSMITALLYKSFRLVIRSFMWLAMGLIFQSMLSPMGVIGFIGCLHYLFKAYGTLAPTNSKIKEEHQAAYDKLSTELKELELTNYN